MKKIVFLGTSLHTGTMQDTVACILERIITNKFTQHVVVNVAKFVNMQSDEQLKKSVQSCDIVSIDGMGVVLGARFVGHKVPERVAGIDLFLNLLISAEKMGESVFFLGAKEDVVGEVKVWAQNKHPLLKIVGAHHGYFWDNQEAVVQLIKTSRADMLFVAITSPKKEIFIERWKGDLGVKFVMGVGGTFDVISGRVERAPLWMQNSGLEWLFRVIQEPRRMWRRYLVTNTKFAFMLVKEKIRIGM